MSQNLSAFLTMIAVSEGTAHIGENGYNVLVGSTAAMPLYFGSYAAHPAALITLRPGLSSTAAGRYQILHRNAVSYSQQLGLKDFSPDAQDAIAAQMLREVGALDLIEAGQINAAISKCAHLWASLPGAGYGQHENAAPLLVSAYQRAGGAMWHEC